MNHALREPRLDVTTSIPASEIEAFQAMVREFHLGKTEFHAAIRARQHDREQGLASLRHLYQMAQGHSGQCRYIARFLMGLYNGTRFPFDLTDLRCIDLDLFEHCMAVLRMDRQPEREVHAYFEDGGSKWENMGSNWRVIDIEQVRQAAKDLAEQTPHNCIPQIVIAATLLRLLGGGR